MRVAWMLLTVTLGYLCGSVSFAVILTRWATGKDPREMGNKNPGTANVGRSVGKGLGALVFFLDGLKTILPLALAEILFFDGGAPLDSLALFAVGIAVIFGHMRPLFFGFRGGGGVGTGLFVYLFFVPVEFLASAVTATVIVLLFFRSTEYTFGRRVPFVFIVLTPVAGLISSAAMNIPLLPHLSIGGHPWHVIAGTAVVSAFLLVMNRRVMISELAKLLGKGSRRGAT